MRGLKGLGVLLAVLAAAYALTLGITTWERVRRSTEVAVEVIARRPYTRVDTFGGSELGGWDVNYRYVVAGVGYQATARRPWPNFDAYHAKVCYAPADPRDHWLAPGSYRCGDWQVPGD